MNANEKYNFLSRCYLLAIIFAPFLFLDPLLALDAEYHNPQEIHEELLVLQETYPDWVRVDSIGHSSQYALPIWMAKLAVNPRLVENKPALLFVGQVHAEEVEGVELTLRLMRYLLENLDQAENRRRLEELELYFIPTANPEGLRVVHEDFDATFRKNCRDNIGDGALRVEDRWGWDTSGVDLNRNFALHWDRGLDLYEREDEVAVHNYFRGPAPFSEPETRALAALGQVRKFQYSIIYHSSRSGLNSQSIVAPWYWGFGKYAPDDDAIFELECQLAARMPTQDGEGEYDPRRSTQRNGQSQDWFYQALGTYQYLVELGAGIQPEWEIMEQIITDQFPAALFLMDLAVGDSSLNDYGTLSLTVTNAETGEPLAAELNLRERSSAGLEPRQTCALNGRFDWLLDANTFHLDVSAPGYMRDDSIEFEILSGERTVLEVELEPQARVRTQFRILAQQSRQPLYGQIFLTGTDGTDLVLDTPPVGSTQDLPQGVYSATIVSAGFLPIRREVVINEGRVYNFYLTPATNIYDERFSVEGQWEFGGPGGHWGVIEFDRRSVLTESNDGDYLPATDAWLLIDTRVDFHDDSSTVMRMIHRPYFEPECDSGRVVIWDLETLRWYEAVSFSQFPQGWDTTYVFLDRFSAGEIHLQLKVTSDNYVEEDGWLIDRITIFQAGRVSSVPGFDLSGPQLLTLQTYPNPTNGRTLLNFSLPQASTGIFALYDSQGRFVKLLHEGSFPAGRQLLSVDLTDYSSGAYFISLNSSTGTRLHSLHLLK